MIERDEFNRILNGNMRRLQAAQTYPACKRVERDLIALKGLAMGSRLEDRYIVKAQSAIKLAIAKAGTL